MSSLRVLLADDHALVRAGMRALLGELPGIEVVAETGDGREALQLVRERKLALRAVARGDTWLSPSLTKRVVATYTQGASPDAVLTPRQREVLQLVAEGHSNKEIASRLNVALKTVETHRTELMDRLGI